MAFVNSTPFPVCLPCFLFTMIWNKNKIRCIDAPKYAIFTHRNIPESEKYIWIIRNVHEVSILFYDWVSCNQTFGCLRLYGDSRVSRAQPRINAYEILLQHDWLLFSHSHSQLSYHITDRLLAAGNHSWKNLWNWPNNLWEIARTNFVEKNRTKTIRSSVKNGRPYKNVIIIVL